MLYIVGLGNPGEKYENSRHNAGRMAVLYFLSKNGQIEPSFNKKSNSSIAVGAIQKNKYTAILPETFMNRSGDAISYFIKWKKPNSDLENLIVIYDDIDLGMGDIKISYNKGSGGHKGLESIIKKTKSKKFIRIRIGVSKKTPKGKIKKPEGEKKVLDFILAEFKQDELKTLNSVFEKVNKSLLCIIEEGMVKAMNMYN